MNHDQARTILWALGSPTTEALRADAIGIVLDLLEKAPDESQRWRIDAPAVGVAPPGWDRNDPKEWADPPEATAGPAFNPSYADLLNQVSTLRAERDALFTAARDVIQNIDRTGRAAAVAHLAEVIGENNREDPA